jgi:hypothetical protein
MAQEGWFPCPASVDALSWYAPRRRSPPSSAAEEEPVGAQVFDPLANDGRARMGLRRAPRCGSRPRRSTPRPRRGTWSTAPSRSSRAAAAPSHRRSDRGGLARPRARRQGPPPRRVDEDLQRERVREVRGGLRRRRPDTRCRRRCSPTHASARAPVRRRSRRSSLGRGGGACSLENPLTKLKVGAATGNEETFPPTAERSRACSRSRVRDQPRLRGLDRVRLACRPAPGRD